MPPKREGLEILLHFSYYSVFSSAALSYTCSMGCLKAFLLHRVVRKEANEQLVATRRDGWGLLGATEATHTGSFSISSVVNLNVVVSTLQVGLHVDLVEGLWQNNECVYK